MISWKCALSGCKWHALSVRECPSRVYISESRKRGVEFKGGGLHDGFGGFDGSGEHLTLLCLSYKIQHNEATVAVLTVLAVMAVAVMTATPLKLNPPPFP